MNKGKKTLGGFDWVIVRDSEIHERQFWTGDFWDCNLLMAKVYESRGQAQKIIDREIDRGVYVARRVGHGTGRLSILKVKG